MSAAILTDLTKCTGCGACVLACEQINGLPANASPSKLSDTAWTVVHDRGGVNVRQQCMHCLDPTCASVCPVGALKKTPEGPVTYEESRCIGCRYCMVACPFSIPTYEWQSAKPKVHKCVMCYEKRVRDGGQPACTSVCPAGATKFGDRDALVEEARRRIETDPDRYVDHIYGLEEVGGTSVLYLSGVPFASLGFPANLASEPYPKLTWDILSEIPNVVGIGGVALAGVYWVINRRMMMDRLRHADAADEEVVDDTYVTEDGAES
jgi:formate dehydrogenase iron-sulfur subunit